MANDARHAALPADHGIEQQDRSACGAAADEDRTRRRVVGQVGEYCIVCARQECQKQDDRGGYSQQRIAGELLTWILRGVDDVLGGRGPPPRCR